MRYYSLVLALFLFATLSCQSQTEEMQESEWKGFKRLDFSLDKRDVRLIIPPKPLNEKPWVWRARFPDYHSELDSLLVSEGFHIAYINTDNQFGSPKAGEVWNTFYEYMTTTYQLQKKVVLSCHSRGGLFVYNWAKKNPEKIACIYADAPVCDFKSWPAGFGNSKGSRNDWRTLKAEYGFGSDEETKAFADNPIDNLEALAAAKVPILHTVGLQDKVVPPEENSFLLVNKYIRLGGSAMVSPCTEGEQKSEGHHYPIENPRLIADFIKYHAIKYTHAP
ncbi:prolyl oligopeptidase family serine peptidase [Flammeovirgaceae bacterium SG7u.132]|nr:prolyl oligopeptidase family serine peptidase [Flammeovirgaceae bacterium SG7u.132]